MFTSAAASATTATVKTEPKKAEIVPTKAVAEATPPTDALTSEDPVVAAFYKSLSPAEMIAHRIATVKLGTSYDVTRTRGFLAWSKTR